MTLSCLGAPSVHRGLHSPSFCGTQAAASATALFSVSSINRHSASQKVQISCRAAVSQLPLAQNAAQQFQDFRFCHALREMLVLHNFSYRRRNGRITPVHPSPRSELHSDMK